MILAMVLALSVPAVSFAQTLDEAARQAARQHDAKVLSARTVQQGKTRAPALKLLTRNGVVQPIRITVRKLYTGPTTLKEHSSAYF